MYHGLLTALNRFEGTISDQFFPCTVSAPGPSHHQVSFDPPAGAEKFTSYLAAAGKPISISLKPSLIRYWNISLFFHNHGIDKA